MLHVICTIFIKYIETLIQIVKYEFDEAKNPKINLLIKLQAIS